MSFFPFLIYSIENKMGNRITETNDDLLIKLKSSSSEAVARKTSNNNNYLFQAEHQPGEHCNTAENSEKDDQLLLEVGLKYQENIDGSNMEQKAESEETPTSNASKKLNSIRNMSKIRLKSMKKSSKDTPQPPGTAELPTLPSMEKEPVKKTNSLLLPPMNTGRANGGRRESFLYRADVEFFDSSQKVRKSSMNSTERSDS